MKIKITPMVRKLVSAAYPDYKGRKVYVSTKIPNDLSSYWDEGSRDYYCFIELETARVMPVETNHPAFEPNKPRALNALPLGFLLLKHSIFAGNDCGITIYCNESELARTAIAAEQKLIEA